MHRAGIFFDLKRYDEAKADLETVIRMRPDYYHAYPSMAYVSFIKEDYETARKFFTKAFEREKDEWAYILLIGICLKREGRAFDAKKYLESSIQKIPRSNLLYHAGSFIGTRL